MGLANSGRIPSGSGDAIAQQEAQADAAAADPHRQAASRAASVSLPPSSGDNRQMLPGRSPITTGHQTPTSPEVASTSVSHKHLHTPLSAIR